MTLSTNVGSPSVVTSGTTAYFTAEEFGAYDDTFFRAWLSSYNYQTGTWGAWGLWASGWDLGDFTWWEPLGTPGLYSMYVDARANYVNNWDTQSSVYYFNIRAATPLSVTTTSIPMGTIGQLYSTTLSASGGVPPYTWECGFTNCTDIQPSGLSFSSSGVLQGVPTSSPGTFFARVSDSQHPPETQLQGYVLDVISPLTITTTTGTDYALINAPYNNRTLHATGGLGAYTWALNSGSLPPGINIASDTGVVSGTPTVAGNYSFTFKVTDQQPVTKISPTYTTVVFTPVVINTSVLPNGKYNQSYNQNLSASGGSNLYTWSQIGGTIPPGLSLNSAGLVSGIPSALGTYTFNAQAVDNVYNSYVSKAITLTIEYAPVTITTAATLPPGNSSASYSKYIAASGGDGTYTWTNTGGTLPTGINLNSSTGELYGTPTTGGDYSFTITANDGVNPTASRLFTLKINAPPAITTASIASGQHSVAYSQPLAASGGSGAYTWSMPVAPVGLTINANSGTISGIPTDIGQLPLTVQVADAQNPAATATKNFTLTVSNNPVQNDQNASVTGCEASSWVCTNSTTDVISGIVAHDQELFSFKGGMQNIAISLFYRSLPAYNGPLGSGWSHNYDIFLTIYADGSILLQNGSGTKSYYTKSGSNYVSPSGDTSVLTAVTGGYKITFRDGSNYNFNSSGKLTSIADRFSNAISFTYTGSDLTGITDPSWKSVTIGYDQTTTPHRISTITDPYGNVYNFSYVGANCSNQLCRVTNPAATSGAPQGYWEYQYNVTGLLQSKRDPNDNTAQYSYYADKRMQTATDPNGRTRTIVYPTTTDTLRTSTLTEKDSGQWLYTYNSTTGAITQKTDPDGNTTNFYYYPNGFIKAKTEPKDGTSRITTFYSYDSYGNLLIETDPANLATYSPVIDPETVTDITTLTSKTPPIKAARHYTYDTAAGYYDRITGVADERGATTHTTTFAYSTDSYGEVVTATATPGNYATATSHITITRKNGNGTVRQLVDANGKITSFTYRPYNDIYRNYGTVGLLEKIIAPDNTSTFISGYDKGQPYQTEFLNNTGVSTLSIYTLYDNLSRLTNQQKYSSTLGSFGTQYTYDLAGNLKSFIDAEYHETKYQYNYNRQVTKITDAKLNDTIFTYSGSEQNGIDQLTGVYDANVAKNTPLESQPHTAYIYDQLGRLDTETDPLGKKIHYTYYDNGLVKEKYDATSATPGTLLVTFTYNNRGQITDKTFTDGTYEHYTYTANGQLETAVNQHISYTYAYYDDGMLKSVTDTTNNRQIYYDQYDNNGQRKQVTILKGVGADQRTITYDYDSANRPWHIASTAGTFNFGYDISGRRQTLTYPTTLNANYVFDDLNRLTSLTHKDGATAFATFNYTQFDNVGNRKTVTGSKNETYGYDENYRLTSLTATKSESFTYDAAGNRLTGPGAIDTAYQSNAANQITQGRKLTYGYDNRGNQNTKTIPGAADKTWTRTWDYNNRLTQEQKVKGTEVRTVTYKYDPFGRRIEKKFVQIKGGVTETETTNYVYDNEDIVVEYFTTAGGTEKTFVTHGHGIDEPLALERGDSYYYYHQDALGSITHITNAAKAVIQSYTYDAYGMATPTTNFRNSYQHTGREYDGETGTLHMRERTRDLIDGNFTSKDKLGFAAGDTNLYRYVNGNVQNFTDPSGNARWKDAGMSLLGVASNSFGMVLGFGLGAVPEPTMLTKVAAVAVTAKSSYGLAVNSKNLYNALTDKAPYSTGGIGTDTACALAPGNKTAKALGTTSELGLDLLAGGIARTAAKNAVGVLNKNAMERVFVRDPSELGRVAGVVQFSDTAKSVGEAYFDLQ